MSERGESCCIKAPKPDLSTGFKPRAVWIEADFSCKVWFARCKLSLFSWIKRLHLHQSLLQRIISQYLKAMVFIDSLDVNVILKVHCERGSVVYEEAGHLHTKESLKTASTVSLAAWPRAQKWDVSCLQRTAQILGTGIHSSSTCQRTHLSFLWRWKLLSFWTSNFAYLCLTLTWGDAMKPFLSETECQL